MSSDQENITPQGPPPPDSISKPLPPPNIPPPNIPAPNIPAPSLPTPSIPTPSAEPLPSQKPSFSAPPPKPNAPEAVVEEIENAPGTAASVNTRIIAALIDGLVGGALLLVIVTILPNALRLVGNLAAFGYMLTRDSLPFLGGQSIGKRVMKIQAVKLDGTSLAGNWESGLIRNVSVAIAPLAIVELIVLLTRDGKPEAGFRLGDEWAKTKVINVAPSIPQA